MSVIRSHHYFILFSGFRFHMKAMLDLLLTLYGVRSKAVSGNMENPVVITLAGDGAELTKDITHCTVHMKVADEAALDPTTGEPLFRDSDDRFVNLQSREHCYPVYCRLGKDSKEVIQEKIGPIYRELTAAILEMGWAVKVVYSGDMAYHWRATGKGGGCKNKKFFCHCCDITKDQHHKPSPRPCAECATSNKVCYHWKKLFPIDFSHASKELDEFESKYGQNADSFLNDCELELLGT